jgi:hypothetical protein
MFSDVTDSKQHHLLPEFRDKLRNLGGMDLTVLDYDGCTSMWVHDWEDLDRFHRSDDFKQLQKDCAHFMDMTPGSLKAIVGCVIFHLCSLLQVTSAEGISDMRSLPLDQQYLALMTKTEYPSVTQELAGGRCLELHTVRQQFGRPLPAYNSLSKAKPEVSFPL